MWAAGLRQEARRPAVDLVRQHLKLTAYYFTARPARRAKAQIFNQGISPIRSHRAGLQPAQARSLGRHVYSATSHCVLSAQPFSDSGSSPVSRCRCNGAQPASNRSRPSRAGNSCDLRDNEKTTLLRTSPKLAPRWAEHLQQERNRSPYRGTPSCLDGRWTGGRKPLDTHYSTFQPSWD